MSNAFSMVEASERRRRKAATFRVQKMKSRAIQIIITASAVLLTVGHAWLPEIKIDAITATLLSTAVLPWLGPLFKSVELPGGVKVDYQGLERAGKKVEESGLVSPEMENFCDKSSAK